MKYEVHRYELYPFQQQAVDELAKPEKHIVIATMGAGKTAISLRWAATTHKRKWLVVTTASARDSGQWYREREMWTPDDDCDLEVISWQGLAKWTIANWYNLEDYCFIFDEVAKLKAGVGSARGRAALQIAKRTDCWAGFTGTPGDRWIDFQAYFIAGGYVKNKTAFMRDFCQVQTFKGYPEIVGYFNEPILRKWWAEMTVCPDTSQMEAELPAERHFTHTFKTTAEYKQLAKTHTNSKGEFLETTGAFCAECRRAAFTKEKQQWLADYLENLGTNSVLFYALNETGDKICEIARKALPKEARIWRICGSTHEIPTAETVGKYDIVVCQWEAGSEGLNLHFANQMVIVQPCYSYSTSTQGRGRIRRIGQKKPQTYHYLKTDGTIEEDIYACLREKGDFSAEVWYAGKKANGN